MSYCDLHDKKSLTGHFTLFQQINGNSTDTCASTHTRRVMGDTPYFLRAALCATLYARSAHKVIASTSSRVCSGA